MEADSSNEVDRAKNGDGVREAETSDHLAGEQLGSAFEVMMVHSHPKSHIVPDSVACRQEVATIAVVGIAIFLLVTDLLFGRLLMLFAMSFLHLFLSEVFGTNAHADEAGEEELGRLQHNDHQYTSEPVGDKEQMHVLGSIFKFMHGCHIKI